MTPIEQLKALKKELIEDSIDGYYITVIDKNGKPRNYNLRGYAEMCVYTEAINAQAEATVNIALENDSDLVQVSDHSTICPICIPYEGKVFSISGKDTDFPMLEQQPAYHPRCKHTLTVTYREILEKYGVEKYL